MSEPVPPVTTVKLQTRYLDDAEGRELIDWLAQFRSPDWNHDGYFYNVIKNMGAANVHLPEDNLPAIVYFKLKWG